MMTLMKRLCALCAVSALMQMTMPKGKNKAGLHIICGLLMLRLTLTQLQEIGDSLRHQEDIMGFFECLMR